MAWCSIKCRQAYEPSRVTSDLDFSLLHLLRREFPNITSFVKQECSVQNHWKRNYILYEMFKRLFASVGEAKLCTVPRVVHSIRFPSCQQLEEFSKNKTRHKEIATASSDWKLSSNRKRLRRVPSCVLIVDCEWTARLSLTDRFYLNKKKLCKLTE